MSQQEAITLFLKKVDLNDLKLCLTFHYNITGRSQRQVLFFQWQGIGPVRTWHRMWLQCHLHACHWCIHSQWEETIPQVQRNQEMRFVTRNNKSDLQAHSRSFVFVTFDRPYTISQLTVTMSVSCTVFTGTHYCLFPKISRSHETRPRPLGVGCHSKTTYFIRPTCVQNLTTVASVIPELWLGAPKFTSLQMQGDRATCYKYEILHMKRVAMQEWPSKTLYLHDPMFSHFDTILACDGHTHTMTAYTVLT